MMNFLLGALIGSLGASIGWYFVARNNQARTLELIGLDPNAKLDEVKALIKEKLK